MTETINPPTTTEQISIEHAKLRLPANLFIPQGAKGLIMFVQGSAGSRPAAHNRSISAELNRAGFATLLLDLLTRGERFSENKNAQKRSDVDLVSERVLMATDWIARQAALRALRVGYFGAGIGTAAALVAAAESPGSVAAVVSRCGRPDLASDQALSCVRAPTLLIVGGSDDAILPLNQRAFESLHCFKRMVLIPGDTDSLEQPHTLATVTALAREWFAESFKVPVQEIGPVRV
jgi:dienelactone hydrolase